MIDKYQNLSKEQKNKIREVVSYVGDKSEDYEHLEDKFDFQTVTNALGFIEQNENKEFVLTESGKKLIKGRFPEPTLNIGYFNEKLDYLKIAEDYIKIYPLIYTKSNLWWKWNNEKKHWEFVDEIDIILSLKKLSKWSGVINQSVKNQILNALMLCGREKFNNLTKPDKNWVQFGNKIVDIKTEEIIEPTPDYFIVNKIPWKLGESEETPYIDKLFSEWYDNPSMLYELIAYCCLADNPIHRLFCLFGRGRNGKTTYQNLIKKFIGSENYVSTDIDRLKSNPRFETSRLYKKVVCFLGETTHNTIDRMDIIKRIIGNDPIPIEWKGKNATEDSSLYCTMIMGTNSIPMVADKTLGCNSKWIIIKFNSIFRKSRDVLGEIPDKEFENLSRKIVKILKGLIERGEFKGEKSYEEKEAELEELSNPIIGFIKNCCDQNPDLEIPKFIFENKLNKYCKMVGLRSMNYKDINKAMKDEGYEDFRIRSAMVESDNPIQHWKGLFVSEEKLTKFCAGCVSCAGSSHSVHTRIERSEMCDTTGTTGTNNKMTSKEVLLAIIEESEDSTIENIREKWKELEKINKIGDFDELIDKLQREGILFNPKPGFLKLV